MRGTSSAVETTAHTPLCLFSTPASLDHGPQRDKHSLLSRRVTLSRDHFKLHFMWRLYISLACHCLKICGISLSPPPLFFSLCSQTSHRITPLATNLSHYRDNKRKCATKSLKGDVVSHKMQQLHSKIPSMTVSERQGGRGASRFTFKEQTVMNNTEK